MLYTNLGNTNLEVSKICLGTWKLYSRCDYISARKLFSEAQSQGITFFDTSDNYGPAESWIGRALKEGYLSRDKIVIATKTGLPVTHYDDFEVDTSQNRIKIQVDKSREILGVDTIDIQQIHAFDPNTPLPDVVGVMNELIEQNKIKYYGFSNFGLEELSTALGICKKHNLIPPISLQNMYNITTLDKYSIDSVKVARESGMHVLAHSPLSRGFLTTKNISHDSDETDKIKQEIKEPFKKLSDLAIASGRNIEQLALAWLSNQDKTIPVVGAYKVEYFKDAVNALDWKLDKEINEKVDEVREEVAKIAQNISNNLTYKILMEYFLE